MVLAGLAGVVYRVSTSMSARSSEQKPISHVKIGSTAVQVEVADTDAAREQGLSGHPPLPEGSGMLFVFPYDGDWGFWMKDMTFPLDIIFIGATQTPGEGSVVSIAVNASPAGYQQDPPEVFYPPTAVRYVLEVPAGFAAAHNIGQDTKVVLQ